MKKRFYLIALAALLAVGICAEPVLSQGNTTDMEGVYNKLIDEYIASCERKSELRDSWSENVRRVAAVNCLKGAFYRNYKEELVTDLIANKVEPKPYLVRYHLNRRFYETVRPTAVAKR
ncbi:MAG: hypothetical protein QNI92_10475 [Desulfobacterales bacterium]|nr:hypothetical protein [Desulfobacterales bacterium]MDJ0912675.1 hypothetical protein [Desulfobacterales bacterium]